MRGIVASLLVLALASLSGCVSLVEYCDPDLDAAAAEAQKAISEYQAKAGHIAGVVTSADGAAVATASVDLLGVTDDIAVDAQGHFAVLDLAPGNYTVAVGAPEHLEQQVAVFVQAGQFSRPTIVLEAIPAPEPYQTLSHFEGFTDVSVIGLSGLSCYCYFEGDLVPEGLGELVLEGRNGDASWTGGSDGMYWSLDVAPANESADEWSYFGGYDSSPFVQSFLAEDLIAGPGHYYLRLEPDSGLMPTLDQRFEAYVTAFYHGVAPEGYTAFVDE